MDDKEAFDEYPLDTWIYEKDLIAEYSGIRYGFDGIIPDNSKYCVKPKTNLFGCSIGSSIVEGLSGFTVPNGCNWYEYLTGIHWTCDFFKGSDGSWEAKNIYIGKPLKKDHKRFSEWTRLDESIHGNEAFQTIQKVVLEVTQSLLPRIKQAPVVNIECIGDKLIEAHLRGNTDPVQWDIFYPIWDDTDTNPDLFESFGFIRIEDTQNHPRRIGFWVNNY